MGESFFGNLSDIKRIAPVELEQILQERYISIQDGRLIYTYWVHMEPWEDKPLLVDNEGQFWIGKKSNGHNFVLEEYGRNISEFLGCSSPEVEYFDFDGAPLTLSRFIHHSNDPTNTEMEDHGQVSIVPRILAAYSKYITDNPKRLSGRLDCDINRGNFLVDAEGKFYQIDFSRPVEHFYTLSEIKARLNLFKLTADPDNEINKKAVAQIKQYAFNELYREFTPKSHKLFPKETERCLPHSLWNVTNLDRLLTSLHTTPEPKEPKFRVMYPN
ncbi:hypothetical protein HYW20_05935 [Candidatus Woesearchaeota archaeon]|nr:hypothetical protein [Candidatus Woesearchaeota archaeon]